MTTSTRREKAAVKWTAEKKAKPSIKDRVSAQPRLCPNCGAAVVRREGSRGPAPTFCPSTPDRDCKKEHNNREMTEGRALIAMAKAWRVDRGAGEIASTAFTEMTRILDFFNAQDLKAGRPRADYYAAIKLHEGLRYADRRQD